MVGDDSWSKYAWDELLGSIEKGDVVPIVGGDLATVPNTGKQFTKWLGRELAESLNLDVTGLELPIDVNQVIGVYFTKVPNAHSGKVHSYIKSIIEENKKKGTFEPLPQPLLDLARITHFKLFLTTTYVACYRQLLTKKDTGGNPRRLP